MGTTAGVLYSGRKRQVHVDGTWLPALNLRSLVRCAHTSHCRRAAGRRLEPKTDSPPGLNVYKYWNIKACQHDCIPFPPIHILNSYGDYPGESLLHPPPTSTHPCPRQHYLWAGGHFVLLISALRYFLATITLKAVSSWWYKGVWLSLGPSFRAVADITDLANSQFHRCSHKLRDSLPVSFFHLFLCLPAHLPFRKSLGVSATRLCV